VKDNYTVGRFSRRGHATPPRRGPRNGQRGARLEAIRRIIAENHVDSQEHLTALLRREGFEVAQATLSRDLKRLGIGKAPTPDGRYTDVPAEG